MIHYQVLCDNNNAGGALKVLLGGTDVLRNAIASETGMPSLEGPTLSLTTDIKLTAGDQIRWGYWYDQYTTIMPAKFGKARSKFTIRYAGSN